ncbi:GFA family protein [Acidovorax sp.]|uniref:GFA family protein n=1 Tax=Acidovorax sp. TaxID=1872122 RepID=UPI0025C25139|nr:GFA family protein [Acidovorax sp.]MCI5070495.1 GFA family protein [Acidovorax sp.]
MQDPTTATTSAQCYCGQVTLQFSAPPKSVIHCHCGQCRRLSGSAFTTWVSFPRSTLVPSGQEFVSRFSATSNVVRHFCSNCGSHVYTLDSRAPEIVGVPAGAIKGELPAKPKAHYFVHHKAAWHSISDALHQFGGESGFEPTAA